MKHLLGHKNKKAFPVKETLFCKVLKILFLHIKQQAKTQCV